MTLRLIGGRLKGRILKAPSTHTTRPTQGMLREAVFNICQMEIGGARFLDLYAGSGAMGLEAISRGASQATFIEENASAIRCIKENITSLQVADQTILIPQDATRALKGLIKQSTQYDLIYVDPPYDLPLQPLLHLTASLLAPHGLLLLEERFNPKQPHKPYEVPPLKHRNTRRFGIALLSIYWNEKND